MKILVHPRRLLSESLLTFPLFVSLTTVLVLSTVTTVSIAQSTTETSGQETSGQATTSQATTAADNDTTSSSHLDLSSNACLQKLDATDIVIASIAFKDGLDSSGQFKELVKRKPWGDGTPDTADEIKKQLETQSPFLIISLTKEQALTLDDHRDIIRWVLVQSPTKTCE